MGKNIQADPAQMKTAAQKLSELAQTYSNYGKQLMQDASTMGDAWQGEDNQSFVAQITGFTEELEAMSKKLITASETLTQQANNYEQRQDAITTSAKSLAN
ncbi:MAG: WXG100 family type VII secretion target [Clostridia bacterium]|nr:WXG100 family type VII secretion target [Clostridia bacterium]